MSGEQIKKILKNEGIGLCALAKKMGYVKEQNLYSVLSVNDVRSGVIENIARNIGKPIGWFYGEVNDGANDNKEADAAPKPTSCDNADAISERFIGLLEEKDRQIGILLNLLGKSSS